MFRESEKSTQVDAFSSVKSYLPASKIKDLEDVASWHNVFRNEVYARIDESIFSCLYSKKATGRPNASIKRLVSMMILKEGEGWTDRQLFENCRYNLKTMYAIGIYNLSETIPSETAYYDFKAKMVDYESKENRCLLSEVFAQITKGQIDSHGFNCGRIRMDSKLIQSNIKRSSRLSLIVEIIRSFCRQLTSVERELIEDKKTRNKVDLIIGQTPANYTYGLKAKQIKKNLIKLGELMGRLVDIYGDSRPHNYDVLYQVFKEHYERSVSPVVVDHESGRIVSKVLDQPQVCDPDKESEPPENGDDQGSGNQGKQPKLPVNAPQESDQETVIKEPEIREDKVDDDVKNRFIVPKQGKDLTADSIQSSCDIEAEFRKKQNESVTGFSLNVTEACDVLRDQSVGVSTPSKPLHLITDIALEGATHTDCSFWLPAILQTKEVTGQKIELVNADGAYGNLQNQITASSESFQNTKVAFSKSKGHPLTYRVYKNSKGKLTIIDLVTSKLHHPRLTKKIDGSPVWRIEIHRNPLQKPQKRYFTPEQIEAYLAIEKITINDRDLIKQRANVEATIRQVSCKLDGGKKSRYRGKTKIKMAAFATALWVNCTRIALAYTNGLLNTVSKLYYAFFHGLWKLCSLLFLATVTNSHAKMNF